MKGLTTQCNCAEDKSLKENVDTSAQAHSEPERQQRADALAAEVASIRQRISKLRNSYAGDDVSETII